MLEPEEDETAPDVGTWEPIAGETASTFVHEVTEDDEFSSYRCVVTVEQPEETPAPTEEPADTATPEQKEAQPETVELISDSMYVQLPADATEAAAPLMLFAAPAANTAPAVALSEDGQWLTGVTSDMEYITAETYAAQGGEAANNAWWTKISGGARAD